MSTTREIRKNQKRRQEKKLKEMIDESINKALEDRIPNIVAQTVEMIRQQSADIQRSNSTGVEDKQGDAIHVWLRRFQKLRPLTFNNANAPIEAENWITHIEKIFNVLGLEEQYKVRLATYKLEEDAQQWWIALQQAKGGESFVEFLDWHGFKELFFQQYFSAADKAAAFREYDRIRQKNDESVTEFMYRFLRLVRMVGATAGSSADQAQKFQWAVLDRYRARLITQDYGDVSEVANVAKNLEFERIEFLASRSEDNQKRGKKKQYQSQLNQYQYQEEVQYADRPWCVSCGRNHSGEVCFKAAGRCFNCGEIGHSAKVCRAPRGAYKSNVYVAPQAVLAIEAAPKYYVQEPDDV